MLGSHQLELSNAPSISFSLTDVDPNALRLIYGESAHPSLVHVKQIHGDFELHVWGALRAADVDVDGITLTFDAMAYDPEYTYTELEMRA